MKDLVLNKIPDNERVTRKSLCISTGLDDREVRKCISELRNEGIKIHSSSDKKGYKLAVTEQEIKELQSTYLSRLKAEYETLVAMFGADEINEKVFEIINKTDYTG